MNSIGMSVRAMTSGSSSERTATGYSPRCRQAAATDSMISPTLAGAAPRMLINVRGKASFAGSVRTYLSATDGSSGAAAGTMAAGFGGARRARSRSTRKRTPGPLHGSTPGGAAEPSLAVLLDEEIDLLIDLLANIRL